MDKTPFEEFEEHVKLYPSIEFAAREYYRVLCQSAKDSRIGKGESMSMASAAYAERAEEMRQQWADKLMIAFQRRDWKAVEKLLKEIESFHFTE